MKLKNIEVIKMGPESIFAMLPNEPTEILGKNCWLLRGVFVDVVNKGFAFSVILAEPTPEQFAAVLDDLGKKVVRKHLEKHKKFTKGLENGKQYPHRSTKRQRN